MSIKLLESAIRQFRHNCIDDFVLGYDIEITDREFKRGQDLLEECKNAFTQIDIDWFNNNPSPIVSKMIQEIEEYQEGQPGDQLSRKGSGHEAKGSGTKNPESGIEILELLAKGVDKFAVKDTKTVLNSFDADYISYELSRAIKQFEKGSGSQDKGSG